MGGNETACCTATSPFLIRWPAGAVLDLLLDAEAAVVVVAAAAVVVVVVAVVVVVVAAVVVVVVAAVVAEESGSLAVGYRRHTRT